MAGEADTDQSDKLVEEVEMMLAGVCVCCLVCFCECVWIRSQTNTKLNVTLFRGGLLVSAGPQHNFNQGTVFNHRSTLKFALFKAAA